MPDTSVRSSRPLRVGWFSTGRGPGSRALLTAVVGAIRSGELRAEIPFVFCNRERGQDAHTDVFLNLAEGYGLKVITRSDRAYRKAAGGAVARMGQPLPAWRAGYDAAMLAAIAPHPFDVAMLAGYMLILWPDTTLAHPFLNLHPAAPGGPKGIWQEVVWQLIAEQARESGVFLHVATPELDEGPIVAYCRYPIRGDSIDALWAATHGRSVEQLRAAEGEENALFKEIRRRGAAREIPLIVRTLAAIAGGRVRLIPGGVLASDGRPAAPLDLSDEVEAALKG
jgi:folate-dependent phosphoribosylglycinamide formyltransferase PurN